MMVNLLTPPDEWFDTLPEWWGTVPNNKLWVDDDGRVAGLVCNWDQCIIDGSKECWTPPRLPDNYDYAYQGVAQTESGTKLPVAIMAATPGHTPNKEVFSDPHKALLFNQGYMDDNGRLRNSNDVFDAQLLYGRFKNVKQGLAFLGARYPHLSDEMIMRIRSAPISGHWQHVVGSGEDVTFLGAVFVNKPGLPLTKVASVNGYTDYVPLGRMDLMPEKTDETVLADTQPEECACKKAAMDMTVQDAPTGDYVTPDQLAAVNTRIDVLEETIAALIAQVEGI